MPERDPLNDGLERLVRRLRSYSPAAWAAAGRAQRVRALAAELAALGPSGHDLPDLPDHALPDMIKVLGTEAIRTRPTETAHLLGAARQELS